MKKIKGMCWACMAVGILTACNGNKNKYDASGTFEATEVIVSSEANGKLLQFDITEGQVLDSGMQVGYVDTVQLYLKKLQLQMSGRSVNSRLSDISKQIAATKQQIATQTRERLRCENLLKNNAANQKQLDDINAQIALLEKQLAAQLSTLENNNRGITEDSRAMDIQVAQLDDQLQKSKITTPIKGTVLKKYAERGELSTPGRVLFKIADVDHMYLRAFLTSDQLSQVQIGQPVIVIADYGDDKQKEYPAIITWISDKSEFTPKGVQTNDERANLVYAVKAAVKNDGYIKIGMYGHIKL